MREEYFTDNLMEIVGGEFRKEHAAFARNFRVFFQLMEQQHITEIFTGLRY